MESHSRVAKIESLTVSVLSENEPSSIFIDRRMLSHIFEPRYGSALVPMG
jgi:hypothetical protein